jgi:hypothetical protein
MVTNEQYLSSFLYLMDNGLAPNAVNKRFIDWLMSIVLNVRLYNHWPHFKRFKRFDIFKRLLACGAFIELNGEEYPFAFICDDGETEIDELISTWDNLMLLYCFVYKKVDYIF